MVHLSNSRFHFSLPGVPLTEALSNNSNIRIQMPDYLF
nr:MAG TPA: hypothetical protein [Caudoviricetes sp.]